MIQKVVNSILKNLEIFQIGRGWGWRRAVLCYFSHSGMCGWIGYGFEIYLSNKVNNSHGCVFNRVYSRAFWWVPSSRDAHCTHQSKYYFDGPKLNHNSDCRLSREKNHLLIIGPNIWGLEQCPKSTWIFLNRYHNLLITQGIWHSAAWTPTFWLCLAVRSC